MLLYLGNQPKKPGIVIKNIAANFNVKKCRDKFVNSLNVFSRKIVEFNFFDSGSGEFYLKLGNVNLRTIKTSLTPIKYYAI